MQAPYNPYRKTGQRADTINKPQPGVPTYTEAWALIEAARRMAEAADRFNPDDIASRRDLREPLRLNWRLWTIFQAQLTLGESLNVPDEVRMNMLTLCKFVDKHTVDTMTKPTVEKVGALVDLNRNIASGLLASLETAVKEAEAADGAPKQDAAAQAVKDQAAVISRLNAEV